MHSNTTVSSVNAPGTVNVDRIYKRFGHLQVLEDVSLSCASGETTCIIGPSGSGKSTLLRCINNLENPDRGLVELDGEVIGYDWRRGRLVKAHPRRVQQQRMRIGMVFQRFNLFPHMSAIENVALGPRLLLGLSKEAARTEATLQLDRVGMLERSGAYARQLSGGQQQRVAIARALAMRPSVMLFDEPTSALDPELVDEVLKVMKGIAAQGMTMIVVTHELNFAMSVAHQIVFMDRGQIVETGGPTHVLLNPREERTRQFVSKVFMRSESGDKT